MKAATIGVPVLAALTVLLVARCVAAGPAVHPAAAHPSPPAVRESHPSPPAARETVSTPAGTTPGTFNATDVAWLQLMIPMTEQMLRLLELTPEQTANPRVTRLAARFVAGHRAELPRLRALLGRSGALGTNVHEGHDMPGMVTAEDLRVVGRATGAAFDRLLVDNLREHLEQGILVSRGEQDAGAEQAVRELAATIERTRTAQLALLDGAGR
ncbi:DUF305 domain-containing protein [Streptosporangium canum]|uniref:DUF305 domain-containing protein n=1 Tax=Streptosporangium canum TaxID=324952 RepID=UPI0037AA385F